MNTNLDIDRLVAAASDRLKMEFSGSVNELLMETLRRMITTAPYNLDLERMMSDMLAYPLPAHVVLNSRNAPELIGECIRDEEKMRLPIKCPFLVQHRIYLTMSCRQRDIEVRSSERMTYAFYLLAYAIRRQYPVTPLA